MHMSADIRWLTLSVREPLFSFVDFISWNERMVAHLNLIDYVADWEEPLVDRCCELA
jgi:hypothetical protein